MRPHDDPPHDPSAFDETRRTDDWMRGLAEHLSRDPSVADDLAQDAWLVALKKQHPELTQDRHWLRAVLLNTRSKRYRKEKARRVREGRAAREEGLPSHVDELARASLAKKLRAAVAALPEPYKTPLELHYFEELSSPVIAKRLGRSPSTVRSQLARGLALLRDRLDLDHGGKREEWTSALAPLLLLRGDEEKLGASTAAAAAGAAALGAWLRPLAAGVVVAAVALVFLLRAKEDVPLEAPRVADGAVDSASRADAGAATSTANPAEAAASARSAAASSTSVPAAAADPATPPADALELVQVVVLDGARPVPGVTIRVRSEADRSSRPRTVSDAEGRASFAVLAGDLGHANMGGFEDRVAFFARADDGRQSPEFYLRPHAEGRAPISLVLTAEVTRASGRVLDATGALVAGALVHFDFPQSMYARAIDADLATGPPFDSSRTDAAGRFEVVLRARPSARIQILAAGYALGDFQRDLSSATNLDFVLQAGASIVGRVTGADGRPVPGAVLVAEGVAEEQGPNWPQYEVHADAEGRFRYVDLDASHKVLRAWDPAAPELAATRSFELSAGATETWDPVLEPAPCVRLVCRDDEGRPLARWRVNAFAMESVGSHWNQWSLTDAEGRVLFLAPDGMVIGAQLYEPGAAPEQPRASLLDLQAAPEPRELVLPARLPPRARVHGRLVEADGAPARVDDLLAFVTEIWSSMTIACDPRTGEFDRAGLVPGHYELRTRDVRGYASVAKFELAPGADLALGDVRLPRTGTLRFDWRYRAPRPGEDLRFELASYTFDLAANPPEVILPLVDHALPPEHEYTLFEGTYLFAVLLNGELVWHAIVAVEAGRATTLRVSETPGQNFVLAFELAPAIRSGTELRLRVEQTNAPYVLDPRVVLDERVTVGAARSLERELVLAHGKYRVAVEGPDGHSAAKTLLIDADVLVGRTILRVP